MPEPLKNLYSEKFVCGFADVLSTCIKPFNRKKFITTVFDEQWEQRELKQRMRQLTVTLHQFLPADFRKAAPMLQKITAALLKKQGEGLSFLYMFLPEYIELYGINDLKTSVKLFEQITTLTSAEFAVRPFIIKYPDAMMQQMLVWSNHKNEYVRRLSSEGCRPRLPWAIALPAFKKDPSPVLPILENLKDDVSETVRRSVANNLNDIAKDHPAVVLHIIKSWKGKSKNTDRIIKHGSRTLLKRGNGEALLHFDVKPVKSIALSQFKLSPTKLRIGDTLTFSFSLKHTEKKAVKLRLEYAIWYVKGRGQLSKKVFKLAEGDQQPGKTVQFIKRQRFTDFTTRKHFAGKHSIAILVNGKEVVKKDFSVV